MKLIQTWGTGQDKAQVKAQVKNTRPEGRVGPQSEYVLGARAKADAGGVVEADVKAGVPEETKHTNK